MRHVGESFSQIVIDVVRSLHHEVINVAIPNLRFEIEAKELRWNEKQIFLVFKFSVDAVFSFYFAVCFYSPRSVHGNPISSGYGTICGGVGSCVHIGGNGTSGMNGPLVICCKWLKLFIIHLKITKKGTKTNTKHPKLNPKEFNYIFFAFIKQNLTVNLCDLTRTPAFPLSQCSVGILDIFVNNFLFCFLFKNQCVIFFFDQKRYKNHLHLLLIKFLFSPSSTD